MLEEKLKASGLIILYGQMCISGFAFYVHSSGGPVACLFMDCYDNQPGFDHSLLRIIKLKSRIC